MFEYYNLRYRSSKHGASAWLIAIRYTHSLWGKANDLTHFEVGIAIFCCEDNLITQPNFFVILIDHIGLPSPVPILLFDFPANLALTHRELGNPRRVHSFVLLYVSA